jgi:type VI secretion system protein ImpE
MTAHSMTDLPIDEQIAEVESSIRVQPAHAAHRWALFQYLCIVRQWTRALQQLQVYGQLEASQTPVVHAYRDLVRAECAREQVMAGLQEPDFVFTDVPSWMRGLHAALGLARRGEVEAADATRETALNLAPLTPGASQTSMHAFSWIGDSDSRLGPVCEFIAAGRYRWLAFDDIARWQVAPPATLADLIWAPCTLDLRDGTVLRGFMPSRYPEHTALTCAADERDALLLGRKTVWRDAGRTGVIASGAKTWTTSAGDVGMFELAQCVFNQAHEEIESKSEKEVDA